VDLTRRPAPRISFAPEPNVTAGTPIPCALLGSEVCGPGGRLVAGSLGTFGAANGQRVPTLASSVAILRSFGRDQTAAKTAAASSTMPPTVATT
jgi:hypothetical protein